VSADDKTAEHNVEGVSDVESASDVEPTDVESVSEVEPTDVEPTNGVEIDATAADADATADEAEETQQDDDSEPARRRRIKVVPIILVALLLVSGALTAWLYFKQYRPDVQSNASAAKSATDAARDGTIALLSYKPDTLDQDFAAAKSHLAGDFLNYYNQFTREIVTPAAKQKAVTTMAQVVGAAPSEMHPSSAIVLVFVNQATTSKDRPDPAMSSSSVLVSLNKINGQWLITKFDPI
jgi:Mce-associated membrane protein